METPVSTRSPSFRFASDEDQDKGFECWLVSPAQDLEHAAACRLAKEERQKANGKKAKGKKAKGERQKAKGKKAGQAAADLVSVLHKIDAFVHIPKENECLDHIQAGNQNRGIKEGGAHQVAACPLVGFQAIANGEDDVPFKACQVGDWPPELPAAMQHSVGGGRGEGGGGSWVRAGTSGGVAWGMG